MAKYLLRIGDADNVTQAIEARNLNDAASQAFIAAAMFLPSAGSTPETIKIVVMDLAQRALATIMFTTLL